MPATPSVPAHADSLRQCVANLPIATPNLVASCMTSRQRPSPSEDPATMTASRRVYLSLRERIVEMELLPGTRIVEKALAEEFGTSRTPVHEAVQRLAEEGLIDVQARVGTFVSRIPLNTLEETMLVRSALEVAIIEKAAERMTPEGIHKLNVVLERQAQCAREGNRRGFFRTDEAFHATLAELSGYPGVWQIILDVKTQIDRYRLLTLPLEGRMTEVLAEHRAVIDALASSNPKQAVRAMREHLDRVLPVLEITRRQRPEFFTV
ncbi:GntR family transcriptional regulator [Ralstonia mannitolilytica]|nr:GntR family transcriptional regulator [Ralstonia mannitolilytica]